MIIIKKYQGLVSRARLRLEFMRSIKKGVADPYSAILGSKIR